MNKGRVLPFRESFLAMLGIALVAMLVALDQTVVGTALPTIVAELRGFSLYAWVATSYLLTSVVAVPIFGRLGDYFGRKPFVMISIVLFTGASVLCGMADRMLFLVLARGLQGIGGGMLVGTGFACVPDLFPAPAERLRWGVMISSAFGLANAVGPSLGGFLTQYYGWRSVFYVNLPIGLISFLCVWRFLPLLRHEKEPQSEVDETSGGEAFCKRGHKLMVKRLVKIDWVGALLLGVALVCLQLFVENLPSYRGSITTWGLVVVSVGAFISLSKWERRVKQPILPLEIFKDRHLSGLFVLAVLGGFSMFSLLFYAPLLFQGGFGMSPQDVGLVITPMGLCIPLASIINSRLVLMMPRPNWMLKIGFVLLVVSCLGIVYSSRDMPHSMLMAFMLLGGFGLGFILPNLNVFVQQIVQREHMGIATALLQTLRMIGGMLGIGITGTLVNSRYANGVKKALVADDAEAWMHQFKDPQLLLDHKMQENFVTQLSNIGHNGVAIIEAARESLVGSIHLAILIAALVALIGVCWVWRLPKVVLTRLSK